MPQPLKQTTQAVALAVLLPLLVVYELFTLMRVALVPRRSGPASGELNVVVPYAPGEKSGASKAMQGLLETLGRGYQLHVIRLYELSPHAGRLRSLLSDYITNALPMPVHCRPFILSPGTVRTQLVGENPVLIEFLSGSLFLFFGRRPRNRLVLREHEPLCRRLLIDWSAASGIQRLLLGIKVIIAWLIMLDVYLKVDRVVALTPEDAAFGRRAFPWLARKITDIPVSMEFTGAPSMRSLPAPRELLFLGNFFHRPNVEALVWFLSRCAPHLKGEYRLHLCGLDQPLEAVRLPASPLEVVRHGFVEDLDAKLGAVGIAVAPVVSGAGVRMKNIFLGSKRMAIVTTRLGNEGIGFHPGVDAVVCDDAQEMAVAIDRLAADPISAAALGERAFEHVRSQFGHDAILMRYRTEVFS